jgi:hypothetical protein
VSRAGVTPRTAKPVIPSFGHRRQAAEIADDAGVPACGETKQEKLVHNRSARMATVTRNDSGL